MLTFLLFYYVVSTAIAYGYSRSCEAQFDNALLDTVAELVYILLSGWFVCPVVLAKSFIDRDY